MNRITDRIRLFLGEQAFVKEVLPSEGKRIVEKALRTTGFSLRQLAGQCGLSATYLSHVRTGRVTISPGAYVELAKKAGE